MGLFRAAGGREATRLGRCRALAASAATVSLVLCVLPAGARATFQFGLQDSGFGASPGSSQAIAAYAALQKVAGTTVRITLPWRLIAPQGNTRPAGFDASNPSDPRYFFWRNTTDIAVKAAVAHHARVLLEVMGAPSWAQGADPPAFVKTYGGSWDVNATELGYFMRAAAERYSGHFPDPAAPGTFLPHVRFWEIWNEENLPESLMAPDRVADYRGMLNSSYQAIKSVDPSDVVATGGLAPVSFISGPTVPQPAWSQSPLSFAAQLFCLHRVRTMFFRNGSCPDPAQFDIFAIHPYTLAATPTKHAYHYDDVLVGDMGKVSTLVHTADKLHTVAGTMPHRIWVTEWGWFTNPPEKDVGDKWMTAARYVAWAMYEMWRADVSLVIWLTVRDPIVIPGRQPIFTPGGGLYASDGSAKPTLRAFAFPFVVDVHAGHGFAWGRVSLSRRVRVTVQRKVGARWALVAKVRTASDGTFYAGFPARGNGIYRALVARGPVSLPYDSTPIPPRRTHAFYSG